jgi:5-formyltetrahydrofolate cyclo-ligase
VKKEIRKRKLKIRDEIPLDIRARKDRRIREHLLALPEFISAHTILLYASFRSEVGTGNMIQETLGMGKGVLLPKVDAENSTLALYEITSMIELTPGYMGIPEPDLPDERCRTVDDADFAIIPGAAFDPSGNRLGYGAGYYDSLLSKRKKTFPIVGLAYEEQLVTSIPAEKHDVRVDIIVTDARVIRIL